MLTELHKWPSARHDIEQLQWCPQAHAKKDAQHAWQMYMLKPSSQIQCIRTRWPCYKEPLPFGRLIALGASAARALYISSTGTECQAHPDTRTSICEEHAHASSRMWSMHSTKFSKLRSPKPGTAWSERVSPQKCQSRQC